MVLQLGLGCMAWKLKNLGLNGLGVCCSMDPLGAEKQRWYRSAVEEKFFSFRKGKMSSV